jgi:hypothetical protein
MHAGLISDTDWLDEELAMFRYLVVGLLDEGVRVVQVVPEHASEQGLSPFGQRLEWQDSRQSWLRQWRLRSLAPALDRAGVSVLHALDSQVWAGALAIGRKLNIPTVLSAWRSTDVPLAVRLLAGESPNNRSAVAAATGPLGKALVKALGPEALVQVVPPGVHVSEAGENEGNDEETFCALITGDGRFDADYEALLLAVAGIVKDRPHAQFFLEGQGHDQHSLWRAARRLELLGNVSLVPPRLTQRDLLLRADVLIQPQMLGIARSLPLQVMARGKPVIARADPWLDYLVADETAWLLEQSQVESWDSLIRRIMDRPQDALALGRAARQWVSRRHIAAKQVAQTLAMYRRVTGEGFKFPHPAAGEAT